MAVGVHSYPDSEFIMSSQQVECEDEQRDELCLPVSAVRFSEFASDSSYSIVRWPGRNSICFRCDLFHILAVDYPILSAIFLLQI